MLPTAGDGNLQRYVRNEPTGTADASGLQPSDTVMDRRLGIHAFPPHARRRRYPDAPTGSWTPREFFGWGSPLIKQTAWGCGGMAAWRAGCPLNPIHGMYMPTDILKIMDATVVT
jgi:hypothetical protein